MLDHSFAISELNRKLANIMRIGLVKEVDYEKAKVRVKIGDIVTDYLPWITSKAGKDRDKFVLGSDKLSGQHWSLKHKPILERFSITHFYQTKNFIDQKIVGYVIAEHNVYYKNDLEQKLAMRDPSNTINKSSPVANNVCTDNVNNITVPNNKHLPHDSSPSSKFDQIFRETFKEDSDIEDTYTNTPEILSPQLTSSTELLNMSYSMKFEKLTQQKTYNKQIIDPLAHQINRDDVESESLDNCREIIRLKSSIKESSLSNGDLMNHTNGTNDYEEINYDPQVKIKNAYNEKFHNEEPDIVEYL